MKASEDIIPRLETWLARDAVPLPLGVGVRVAGGAEMTREIKQHLDELAVYLDVLQQIEPRGISLEIGFYRGGTHFAWSQLFAEVISIESDHLACHHARVEFPHPSSRVVHGDSTKPETIAAVQDILAQRPVDHLFIDGDYHTPSVREYFRAYAPMVRAGGVIGFHDSHHPRSGVGSFLVQLAQGGLSDWPASEIQHINLHPGEEATGISYVFKA